MGKTYESITPEIRAWIANQHMFFVGTAPTDLSGSVNISPKGLDTLRVLDDHSIAYLDYGGSGVETIAHLRNNKRIVLMMCAFAGPPKIFRFHGSGSVITPLDERFAGLATLFNRDDIGIRAIIRVKVSRITDSCGYGVPLYQYQSQREISTDYMRVRGADGIRRYQEENNLESIDGLPGISLDEARAWSPPAKK